MLRAADELDPREEADTAGQQHGETPQLQASLLAGAPGGHIPPAKLPAVALVMDMVEQAALRHQQGVRLEGAFCGRRNKSVLKTVAREGLK